MSALRILFTCLYLVLPPGILTAHAQQTFAGSGFVMPLLTGAIAFEDEADEVRVARVMGRSETGESAVDVRHGDVVRFIDGERIQKVDALRTAYEAVPAGAEVKLGLYRYGQPLIVSFMKPSMEELERSGMRIRRGDGEGGPGRSVIRRGEGEGGAGGTIIRRP